MTRRVAAIIAVAVATYASALALTPLISFQLWRTPTLIALTIVAAALVLARHLLSGQLLPTAIGTVVSVLTVTGMFFAHTAVAIVVPTPATYEALTEKVAETMAQIRSSSPPLSEGDGAVLLMVAGILIVFLLAELLAVGAWAPAWSALPFAGFWSVPIALGAVVPLPLVLAAVAAFLAVLAIQARDDSRPRLQQESLRTTLSLGLGILAVGALAAPVVLAVPSPIRIHPAYELSGSGSTRLDLGLDLRDDLLRGQDVALASYSGATPSQLGPLHAYTVTGFSGSQWEVPEDQDHARVDPLDMLWPDGAGQPDTDVEPREVSITIRNLAQDRLLVPGEPRSVRTGPRLRYSAATDEIVTLANGEVTYELSIYDRGLQPQDLVGASVATDVDPELLAVPETGYEDDIAALTEQVVADADAESPYSQILAIQNYLRDPANFTYTTEIPAASTPDAVWDFLNDRQGYCVQFATAMTVMLRTLDIPTRVAVGFLPGSPSSDGTSTITAHDAHAWPQVFFEGLGWVRFEPTPATQSGAAPGYAPPPEQAAEIEEVVPTDAATATTAPEDAAATATQAPAGGAGGEGRSSLPLILVLTVLIAVAVLAAWLARRRAGAVRVDDLRGRWASVCHQLAVLGIDTSAAQTPRAIVREARETLQEEAADAVAAIADHLEDVAYGHGRRSLPSRRELDRWSAQIGHGVAAARRRSRELART